MGLRALEARQHDPADWEPNVDAEDLGAVAAQAAIGAGRIKSEELVGACLDRIRALEPTVQAWAHLDPEYALAQARAADRARQEGRALGPLHGIPVGVKDIFDTADLPTENGTILHAGRRPTRDATAVALLRAAGAVIMGKTVSTELAVYGPGKTRNPHDPQRTPGGSSSGSAAAVAAGMVPVALGSQTNGSVIRPASYCGTFGYKPTHGLIPRTGVLKLSRHLDHVGVFARSIEDLALIAQSLMRFDPRDPDTRPQAERDLLATAASQPPVPPRLGFVRSPVWDQASEDTKAGFSELVAELGDRVAEMPLPVGFDEALALHRTIFEADLARNLAAEYDRGRDKLSSTLREIIERGQRCLAVDYVRAVDRIPILAALLETMFEWCDALLTPAAGSEAPLGLESTGSPIFCTIWTLCGVPTISVPILQGAAGLPIGVQLVGARGDDARLLRTARWLVNRIGE
jgi:Asp-tRNA(Asn)/Glu-tRNA(Gln) amidotransferase A subunit family amidase